MVSNAACVAGQPLVTRVGDVAVVGYGFAGRVGERLVEHFPGEQAALDPHGEPGHAGERFEVAQIDGVQIEAVVGQHLLDVL